MDPKPPPSFQDIFPAAGPWVEDLSLSPFATGLQDFIAVIEIPHILGLFMLAGVSLVVNLRLMGLGLREAPPSVLWRALRPWFHIGLALALASGVALGLTSALKAYSSVAFLVKMIALLAAVIFTYFVTAPVALADGAVSRRVKAALGLALVIWLGSLVLFATQVGVNPGMIHLMTATGLLGAVAMQGRLRWALLIGTAAVFVAWQAVTHIFVLEGTTGADLDRYFAANRLFMVLSGGWIFGAALLNVLGVGVGADSNRLTRTVAYGSILSWVTVAAAGRWIAFAS